MSSTASAEAMAITPQPLQGIRLAAAAFALGLANFVVVLDTTVANVAVPHIAGGLAASATQGTWVITSYAVADAIAVPLTGWLAMRFGTVRWFLFSIIGFGLFSLLCGLAQSIEQLLAFRVLQGFAGGPLMPLSQILLMQIFPKEKAGAGLGIWAMTTTTAPILGPILGGTLSDNWSWPWIFFINLPVVAIVVMGCLAFMKPFETRRIKARIDVIGLILLVLSVGSFQIMIDEGRLQDWFSSNLIIVLAIVAAISFAAFVLWELTASNPVVDLRVFRHRGFTFAALAMSLGFAAFFSQVVLTPLWLQQTAGYTATHAGYVVGWLGFFAVLTSPIAAGLIGKVDPRLTISIGLLWMAFVSTLRADWNTDVGYWTLVMPHLLHGLGMSLFFVGLSALAVSSVPEREQTSAAGLLSFLRTLASAIGTAVAMTAWDWQGRTSRSELTASLNDPEGAMSLLQQAGLSFEQARVALEQLVEVQAATLGVLNLSMAAAVGFVLAAIAVWLAPKPRSVTLGSGH